MKDRDRVVQIIQDVAYENGNESLKAIDITDDMSLMSGLGLDSFMLAQITVHIENEFGVDIFESGIVSNINEILNKLPDNVD